MKNCLSIAGSDCSGGAGIQADIKTFSALGCFGMSVIVSVVAENTSRVISIQNVNEQVIKDQIDAVFEDIEVDGVKVGMLSGKETMKAVAEKLREYKPKTVVIDPVMVAKGGYALMQSDALETLKKEIIPLSTLLTPNIPESETITGMKIEAIEDMKAAAKKIHEMGAENVLIKGGHLEGDALDILFDGKKYYSFTNKRINTKNTHGTGCTLSSAITANLANGMDLPKAVEEAKKYVTQAIKYSLNIGRGHGPTNHFFEFYNMKGKAL
ncbi:MAG: bifunctional hydroxymethylpyrimidine kinase/phosphomethylpyrimidine kinase [Bacillota bacterium]|nr:bifunctional hydroxymethylpyrimidine kinase/phosphomethylpyrimidine kinase [Bacillota bacterium]